MGKPVLQFLDNSILFLKGLLEPFLGRLFRLLKIPDRGTEGGDLLLVTKDTVF